MCMPVCTYPFPTPSIGDRECAAFAARRGWCRFLNIDASNPAAPTRLTALESTPSLHNVIVCTLCSCYPQSILGLSPQWYRARSYRARCGRRSFGLVMREGGFL